jgi:TRAP-type uncharacterized transport system substrate-binding protein
VRTRAGIALLALTGAILLITLLAALRPLPSRELALATGAPGSAYASIGEQYRAILARDGVRLRLVPTSGAVENVRLLTDRRSGIAAGFVQADTVDPRSEHGLESLGTLFYEPVWLFCRCPDPLPPLQAWNGWRVSIGPQGSAGRPLALRLLQLNGVAEGQLQLLPYLPEEAAQALLDRRIDALFTLTGWDSPVVQRLARAPDIRLVSFTHADAYVALDPDLSKLVLPKGVADLAANRPPEDTLLIASKASLAVRADLHPALQYLLLRAAAEVHAPPGMFQRAGEFPAPEPIDLPLSEEARDYYRSGPTLLQRSLPFWLAQLVQRTLILLLPIAGIIYPLWSLLPRMYNWQRRRRVDLLYRELKTLEAELRNGAPALRKALLQRLDELDRRAQELRLPGSYGASIYNLRDHIGAVRERAQAEASP